MLGRISRGIGHKSGGKTRTKYRFDVVIEKLDNLPAPVKKCRVVWSRGPKLQMTDIKDVNKGAVVFKQKLSQIATMYQDAKGGFESKEYKFQVQVPGKEDNKLLTVGRADLDMSQYVLAEGTPQSKMIPMMFKVGMATGYLKVSITAEAVAGGADSDDGMTEVSAMTGMTANLGEDQDLSGFDEDRPAHASSGGRSSANSRLATAGASPAKLDSKAAISKASSSPARSRAQQLAKAAAKADDDDEISPMSMSPTSSGELPQQEASSKPVRAAGKPSTIDKTAAADARAQLFGTGPGKVPRAAPSTSSSGSRLDPPQSEDDARAALFGTSSPSSSNRASTPPSSKAAGASRLSVAPDSSNPAATSKPAAFSAVSPATPAEPSWKPSAATSEGGAGPSAAPVARRALLDRSSVQQAQPSTSAPDAGPSSSSSKQQPRASGTATGHSLSDSDNDSLPEQQQVSQGRTMQQPVATRAAQGTAAAALSRAKQQALQQVPAPENGNSMAAKALASENEKLKAQLVALRQQAADAEESRRMAVLAADNAAAERDEFQGQVQELQEQLKEALVSLITPEEAAELKQQLQELQQQLSTQQQQQQAQQQSYEPEMQAWQSERSQLQQQLADAQDAMRKAQQDADKQVQQLQAEADSHASLMHHLSWQLEAAQQALQQQQQEQQVKQPPGQKDGGSAAETPGVLSAQLAAAADRASSIQRQWPTVLQFLADEVQALSRHDLVHQCLTNQLLEDASSAISTMDLDGAVQGPVLEILGGLRAAAAALLQQAAEQTGLKDSLKALSTAAAESQKAREQLQQECSSQASSAAAEQQILLAELSQLRKEHAQLAQATQGAKWAVCAQPEPQLPSSPPANAAMLSSDQPQGTRLGNGLATAAPVSSACKACAGLCKQLTAAHHKTIKLTAARDKLEIILHDLETASAEEQQQLEHQLAAANKSLRSTSQQLIAAQQQLVQAQQELAASQQKLQSSAEHLAGVQQQLADTTAELQQLRNAVPNCTAAAPVAGTSAQVIALAESAGPSGVEQALLATQEQATDLQRQLAEADGVRRGLEKELARARKQLSDEQSERNTLEEHMITRLEDMGDEVAQETVAAYEAKYKRLKSRYRELTELHREEVDRLHDEIGTLQERVVELEALAAQLEAAKSQAQHGEVTLADTLAKASKASNELTALREENQMLTQQLISFKLELALCCEREVIGRHELYKTRETNLKLASKMTKLETLVYANKK